MRTLVISCFAILLFSSSLANAAIPNSLSPADKEKIEIFMKKVRPHFTLDSKSLKEAANYCKMKGFLTIEDCIEKEKLVTIERSYCRNDCEAITPDGKMRPGEIGFLSICFECP